MLATLMYISACGLISYLGRNHKFGPTGWFFVSLLFTPLIASLLIMIGKEETEKKEDEA